MLYVLVFNVKFAIALTRFAKRVPPLILGVTPDLFDDVIDRTRVSRTCLETDVRISLQLQSLLDVV